MFSVVALERIYQTSQITFFSPSYEQLCCQHSQILQYFKIITIGFISEEAMDTIANAHTLLPAIQASISLPVVDRSRQPFS